MPSTVYTIEGILILSFELELVPDTQSDVRAITVVSVIISKIKLRSKVQRK